MEAKWVAMDSTCRPITSTTGSIVISITIEITGVTAEGSSYIDILRRILSILLKVPAQSILIWNSRSSSRRLMDAMTLEVRVSIDTSDKQMVDAISSLSPAAILEEAKMMDPAVFPPTSSMTFTKLPVIVEPSGKCEDGFINAIFNKEFDGTRCEVRLSDASMKTNGLVLVDKFTANAGYCINPGYYYIGCNGATTVNVKYVDADYKYSVDLTAAPHWKVLKLEQVVEQYTTVPESHKKPDFDKSKPLTGKPAYPADPTYHGSDFTCDQKGYLKYLSKWTPAMKCTSRDPATEEFQTRLGYFIDSCEKIHDWNTMDKYRMEFTFYADWHPDEFEEITTTKQRYSGIKTPVPSVIPVYNNSNLRYLMPSMDPCDDVFGERRLEENTLGEYICKPQNCTVSWAFATTMSIEYAIKKLYFEEYDQIVEVALSAQELIDCVGKEHGVTGKVCDGLPLAWVPNPSTRTVSPTASSTTTPTRRRSARSFPMSTSTTLLDTRSLLPTTSWVCSSW